MKTISFYLSFWGRLVWQRPFIRYTFVILFLICCVQKTAVGQNEINFKHYVTEKNQIGDDIQAIIQDRNGWLWIGTNRGLKRFDGREFLVYRHELDDTTSLSSNSVRSLYEDRKDRIWIGGSGLFQLDPATNEVMSIQHDLRNPKSLSDDGIYAIFEDSREDLWIGAGNGLNRMVPDEGYAFEHFLEKDGLPGNSTRQIREDQLGLPQLCRAVGLSRSQLFRKLKALTGKSTTIVIRSIRLQRGRKLLQTTEMNVSEVAYAVGFRDLAYFSKCFQEEYGEAPSSVRVGN